jgi:hypothetical protein
VNSGNQPVLPAVTSSPCWPERRTRRRGSTSGRPERAGPAAAARARAGRPQRLVTNRGESQWTCNRSVDRWWSEWTGRSRRNKPCGGRPGRRVAARCRCVWCRRSTRPCRRTGTAIPGPGRTSTRSGSGQPAQLADAARAAAEEAPGVVAEQKVLDGFPIPRLLDESRSAQLIVIGDRGLGGFGRGRAGGARRQPGGGRPRPDVGDRRTRSRRCGRVPGERGGSGLRVRGGGCSGGGASGRVRMAWPAARPVDAAGRGDRAAGSGGAGGAAGGLGREVPRRSGPAVGRP